MGGTGMRIAFAAVILFGVLSSSASAQMWGGAEYLYFSRLSGSSAPVTTGPGGLSSLDSGGTASGYRFTIGGYIGQFEVEGAFMNIENMSDSASGTFANPLSFDSPANDTAAFGAGVPVTHLPLSSGLYRAATYAGSGGVGDETTEVEFLQPGATYQLESFTDIKSGEVNFGTNRNLNPWRVGIGYRTFLIKDGSSSLFSGTFDAVDITGGLGVVNDGLSNEALVAAGYQNVTSPDGFDSAGSAGGPDTLAIFTDGYARNELHGAQLTGAYQLFPLDWLTVELFGKAGLFYNTVQGTVTEQLIGGGPNDDSVYQRSFSGKKHAAAFAGTLGLKGIIPITDYINITAGYEAMFFSGIGLGSRQTEGIETSLTGTQAYVPRTSNSLIVHGGTVGLQLSW